MANPTEIRYKLSAKQFELYGRARAKAAELANLAQGAQEQLTAVSSLILDAFHVDLNARVSIDDNTKELVVLPPEERVRESKRAKKAPSVPNSQPE